MSFVVGSVAARWRLCAAVGVAAVGLALVTPVVAVAAADVPNSVADAATASRLARQANKQVEVATQTTRTAQTVANPDGSWTLTEYTHPVRVKQNGGWTGVDATLVTRPDGTVGPKASTLDVALNPGGRGSAGTPIVKAGVGDKQVGLTWPTDLPAPVLSGDTATYLNVLPDVDLTVKASTQGYAETLVIKTPAAAKNPALATIDFGLFTHNTTVTSAPSGMQVTDSSGAVLFIGDASRMWDSSGAGSDAEKQLGVGGGTKQALMGVSGTPTSVSISPDQKFLADPNTKYPVSLDPDTYCTTCGVEAHLVVQSGYPDAHNYNAVDHDLSNLKAGYENYDDAGYSISYVQMSTAQVAGAKIHDASFNGTLLHSASCSPKPTGLWLTGPITSDTTWRTSIDWILKASEDNTANCHDAPNVSMQFKATTAVQYAADRNVASSTFALAMSNSNDGMAAWRRFSLNPYLQVNYDRAPNTPTDLRMQYGTVPCVQGEGRPWVYTRTPQLQGQVSDPDGGQLTAAFGLDQGPASAMVPGTHHAGGTVVGTPGPNQAAIGQFTVPGDWIGADGVYSWVMAATDGELWSAETSRCEFTVDSAVPLTPSLSRTDPAGATTIQGDTAHFSVSVGLATAGLYDIDHFIYSTDGSQPQPQGSPSVPATRSADGSTATANLSVTAVNGLQNYVKVKAVNKAGTPGPDATVTYHADPVTAPKGLVAAWGLDEMGGRSIADSANATAGNAGITSRPGTLVGGLDWVAGHDHGTPWTHPDANGYGEGVKGALTMDGSSGYGHTSGPVVDTSKSYSVSAWVKLSDTNTYHTVLSQDGATASAFYLQYAKDVNAWSFTVSSADQPTFEVSRALGTSPPAVNVWTHLVGAYDGATGAITLYVDGVKQGTAVATGWSATGDFVIGAAKGSGNRIDYLPGVIDSPQVWQRVLSGSDAHDLATVASPLANYSLAEGCAQQLTSTTSKVPSLQGNWAMHEGSGSTAKDSAQFSQDMTLNGGYTWADGHAGKTVQFDGTSGYGSAGVVVDTSHSFTVSAWARPDDLKGYYAVVTQHGSKQDAFQIRYSPDVNRWIFGMTTADDNSTDNYQWAIGTSVPQAGQNQWTLVTGVYDATAKQVRLYVNGKLEAQRAADSVWNAAGTLKVGSLNGTSTFFKGAIDQVQIWGRALSDDQVAALSGASYYDAISKTSAAVTGGVSLGTDSNGTGGPTGCAAQFDNTSTGQVLGARPDNLRTDRSYTVEAWVKHTATADGSVDPWTRTAVAVSDAQYSPFSLGYRAIKDAGGAPHGRWSFLVSTSATQAGGWIQLSDADIADNTWTHLVGTYDAATGTTALYVNGVKQNTAQVVAPTPTVTGWNGAGGVVLGQDVWTGKHQDPWYGRLAGARLYSGVRTVDGIHNDLTTDNPGQLFGVTN